MSNNLSDAKRNEFYPGSPREGFAKALAEHLTARIMEDIEHATRCCPNCEHFRQGTPTVPMEICQLANKRPPAKVIAFGCEAFKDCIPF